MNKRALSLDIIATDAVTGVASVWVSLNGGAAKQVPYNATTTHYTSGVTLSPGNNTLVSWGIDNVGNSGQSSTFLTSTINCRSPCN